MMVLEQINCGWLLRHVVCKFLLARDARSDTVVETLNLACGCGRYCVLYAIFMIATCTGISFCMYMILHHLQQHICI